MTVRRRIMDIKLRDKFTLQWKKYFNSAELPLTFYYTNEEGRAELARPGSISRCVIGAMIKVRQGISYTFDAESIGCFGGRRYLGFPVKLQPTFKYFISCGLPGKVEGERYKKTPELVEDLLVNAPKFEAPRRFVVFKRWDKLEEADDPEVVIFFARPDVLAGLFTLANFDEATYEGVITPFGSGCSSSIQAPYLERISQNPRCVIGLFDPSARPFAAPDEVTFSAPVNKFWRMVDNMDESFLITPTWKAIQKRIP
jgi:hypothetical protein